MRLVVVIRAAVAALTLAGLAACADMAPAPAKPTAASAAGPVTVHILAINDFHGALEPPPGRTVETAPGVNTPAGGAAYLAATIRRLRAASPNTTVVGAGDLIGASPLASALFLDEPSIEALNAMGLEYSAVGNHEFDRGRRELLRLAHGGCQAFTKARPCALDAHFPGAKFGYLAANVVDEQGNTLFPPYAIKTFGQGARAVKVAFVGLTLHEAPTIIAPSAIAGLRFPDEADTVNALVPRLKREGADAIVVLIHQGAYTDPDDDATCRKFHGDLQPILDRLDPAVDVVVSGHTHRAYICDYARLNAKKPFLVTSAGLYGDLVTDIELAIDPSTHRVTAKDADNVVVHREQPAADVAALVDRAVKAAAPLASRNVGKLTATARKLDAELEWPVADLAADAELAATRAADAGGAQVAFINRGGVRTELKPAADGSITYEQIFAAQPFANTLIVKSFTGAQLRALLEQQLVVVRPDGNPDVLAPSDSLRYAIDLSRPAGQRVLDIRVEGRPLDDAAVYRVAFNSFLAQGGEGLSAILAGTDPHDGPPDLEALEAYFAHGPITPPTPDRIRIVNTPK